MSNISWNKVKKYALLWSLLLLLGMPLNCASPKKVIETNYCQDYIPQATIYTKWEKDARASCLIQKNDTISHWVHIRPSYSESMFPVNQSKEVINLLEYWKKQWLLPAISCQNSQIKVQGQNYWLGPQDQMVLHFYLPNSALCGPIVEHFAANNNYVHFFLSFINRDLYTEIVFTDQIKDLKPLFSKPFL